MGFFFGVVVAGVGVDLPLGLRTPDFLFFSGPFSHPPRLCVLLKFSSPGIEPNRKIPFSLKTKYGDDYFSLAYSSKFSMHFKVLPCRLDLDDLEQSGDWTFFSLQGFLLNRVSTSMRPSRVM